MIRELRHSASKLRRVESNFGGLVAPSAVLPFFAEIAAPNAFCIRQKALGCVVPEGAPIQKRHGKNRVILMRIMIRELRHSASKLRRVESNFGGLVAPSAVLPFFAEIAAPNAFCIRQKALGCVVPEGAPIQKRHGKNRVILMRIMIRELRHSANKLRRVESNFGGSAAVGKLFGSLPKLPHPIFFAQGKKYVGTMSLRAYQKQRHG